jgi:hypothetical protein
MKTLNTERYPEFIGFEPVEYEGRDITHDTEEV